MQTSTTCTHKKHQQGTSAHEMLSQVGIRTQVCMLLLKGSKGPGYCFKYSVPRAETEYLGSTTVPPHRVSWLLCVTMLLMDRQSTCNHSRASQCCDGAHSPIVLRAACIGGHGCAAAPTWHEPFLLCLIHPSDQAHELVHDIAVVVWWSKGVLSNSPPRRKDDKVSHSNTCTTQDMTAHCWLWLLHGAELHIRNQTCFWFVMQLAQGGRAVFLIASCNHPGAA